MENLDKWENDIKQIITEKIPNTEHNDCIYRVDNHLYYPPCRGCIIYYFFTLHKPKIVKAIEILDKYVNVKNGSILDVGTWVSVIGYYFNLKCGMRTDSICIDCPDWELDGVEKHYQYDLSLHNITDVEKYDLVIQTEMLSHFPGNIHKLLKQVIDACKIGGIIFISDALGMLGEDIPKDVVISDYVGKNRCPFQLRQFRDNEIIEIVNSISSQCKLLETGYVSTGGFTGLMQMTVWRKE